MEGSANTEVWLRGPLPGVPDLLQPAAHAMLQALEEIRSAVKDLETPMIWARPANVASIAFHLQHIPGVLDRLYTYAAGKELSFDQLKYLSNEGLELDTVELPALLQYLQREVNRCIEKMKLMDPATLTEKRVVGRKKLPSTLLGLIFHAAEHMQRHTGQLLVTAAIVKNVG